MNVLIADDEEIVLNGLKQIIDWQALGFTIAGVAHNGKEALDAIMTLNPELVLLDIRMPILSGIEVVQQAASAGFQGKFIILSGISDFKSAQTAMRYGVDYYLTKPIDEDELTQAVTSIHDAILAQAKNESSYVQYREKAKTRILEDILLNECDYKSLDLDDLHLKANVYQIISYENYHQETFHMIWDFAELLLVDDVYHTSFDTLDLNHHKVILLKGQTAINKFNSILAHYTIRPQKSSPLDNIFLTYGRVVNHLEEIYLSYQDVFALSKRRFFCEANQHVVGYDQLPDTSHFTGPIPEDDAPKYAAFLCDYIQAYNRTAISQTFKDLSQKLFYTNAEIPSIKHFLTDIYILVKQKITYAYPNASIPFSSNASVIDYIGNRFYLFQITSFLAEQFEIWIQAIGCCSGESVLSEILNYIQHNYSENLKLETIASLFGYNSSYLGKIFNKKVGVNFNAYVDEIRIEESKKLLEQDTLKVYEIASQVGYSNVDYFHKKFKKYVGLSPAEYRRSR